MVGGASELGVILCIGKYCFFHSHAFYSCIDSIGILICNISMLKSLTEKIHFFFEEICPSAPFDKWE